ncbi:MAG: LytTR family transcriptional regulator DNA-binding domain-containing protein, partial [Vallitaleaceae bacterium]|nr:LytTR family transcriptional regulator DNA-binding domain-containing protein [Vallitaleaceae bacterium]
KIRVEYISEGENEILIRCDKLNDEIVEIMDLLNLQRKKLSGYKDGERHLLEPSQIYYCESVDSIIFAYTKKDVYKIQSNLNELENQFKDIGFFRCSKSLIINLNAITSLKSMMANRIDATLKNGEHIIISRHYAKMLREVLQDEWCN